MNNLASPSHPSATLSSHVPELLMPAGSPEKLRFALAYGASAVYAGVPIFSLRARENDFKPTDLAQSIDYCHSRGKKIYLTMNIYAHNNRIDRFLEAFLQYYDLSPDGFIMTDIGLISKALKLRPEATIHLSTQANATNWTTVEFFRDLGVKRVILSRELSLEEIGTIRSRVPDIELESFVHGSICIAYSGRCLISNYLNHRDANDGTCTNSCRWQYKLQEQASSIVQVEAMHIQESEIYKPLTANYSVTESKRSAQNPVPEHFPIDEDEHGTYLMNSKDLCAIELLKDLHEVGICSFKAEGRTKSIYYLAIITRAYSRAIDDFLAQRHFNPENLKEVMTTSNRTLMTGFLLKRPREYGENFEDGASLPLTHHFVGQVLDYRPSESLALVDFRNKVVLGQAVEWITPTMTIEDRVNNILTDKFESTPSAHGGLRRWINCPFCPDEFTLLRARL